MPHLTWAAMLPVPRSDAPFNWFVIGVSLVIGLVASVKWWNRLSKERRRIRIGLAECIAFPVILSPGLAMFGWANANPNWIHTGFMTVTVLAGGAALGWLYGRSSATRRLTTDSFEGVGRMVSGALFFVGLNLFVMMVLALLSELLGISIRWSAY